MSDGPRPVEDPAAAAARIRQGKIEAGIRHLYSAALTIARLTDGDAPDAPRLLVAAAANGVSFLIERIVQTQAILEKLPADDPQREAIVKTMDRMAGDLSKTMQEFDDALNEGITSLRQMREAEDEPDDAPPAPVVTTH